MYKVGDRIKYKCPFKIQSEGMIVSKLKLLEGSCGKDGSIVYLVEYDLRCTDDFVLEEDVIGKIL